MRAMEMLTRLVVGTSSFGDHLLKRKASGILVAALAFLCGAGLSYVPKRAPRPVRVAPAATPDNCPPAGIHSAPVPAANSGPADDWEDTPELEAWKNRRGGTPLPLDYDRLSSWTNLSDSKVAVLPAGRILTLAGEDLYLFDANRRVVWKHDTPHAVTNFLYVKATGVIYSRDDGNDLYILDAATGRVLRSEPRESREWYGAMIPYGEDTCLIMDEAGSYRVGYDGGPEPTQDGVAAWRGTRMLWRAAVPADAELQVVGSKIFAVTKTKSRILVREIKVPPGQS